MFYERSVSHFKKPFANGSSREVYYSRKHKLVFKVEKQYPYIIGQTETEEKEYNKMPKKYRPLFPVVHFFTYNGKRWEALRRVRTAYSFGIDYELDYEMRKRPIEFRQRVERRIKKPVNNFKLLQEFFRVMTINDLHSQNWGIDSEGNILILDWGI